MQSLTGHPLFLKEKDFSASGKAVGRGSTAKRQFTLENLGEVTATINVWIMGTDEKSEPLSRWCTITPTSLVLESNQRKEITLSFDVPLQAKPDLYNYELLAEAPNEYPTKPAFRRPQQLRVSRLSQDGIVGNPPGFFLQPATTPATPHILKAGEELEISVTVENRSELVEQYYLTCPEWQELEGNWFRVKYPETGLNTSGIVRQMQWLDLNPGKTGEITLVLTPPKHTLAGNYSPTIRLSAHNDKDLVLLDIVYLKILPDDSLDLELTPLFGEVPKKKANTQESQKNWMSLTKQEGKIEAISSPSASGQKIGNHEVEFQVIITNHGNIRRELTLQALDKKKLFHYTLNPPLFRLQPGGKEEIYIIAKPRRWMGWRRPLWGEGIEFSFNLFLENTDSQLFLPETQKPPQIVEKDVKGRILWRRRPLWIISLIITLLLAGLGYLIWKLLYIPAPPKLVDFDTEEKSYVDNLGFIKEQEKPQRKYQEFKNEPVLLSWEVENYRQLNSLLITHINSENKEVKKEFSLEDLEKSENPETSEKLCQFNEKNSEQKKDILICTQMSMGPKAPGNHTFKIEIFPKEKASLFKLRKRDSKKVIDFKTTETLEVEATPVPKLSAITMLNAKQTPYEQINNEPIAFQWKMNNLEQITKVHIIRRGDDGTSDLYALVKNSEGNSLEIPLEERANRKDNIRCDQEGSGEGENNIILDCNWSILSSDLPAGNSQMELEVFQTKKKKDATSETVPGTTEDTSDFEAQEEPSDVQKLPNTITIKPKPLPPLPSIVSFSSSQSSYQELDNGEFDSPISFDFVLMHYDQIKSLKLTATPEDGKPKTLEEYQDLVQISPFCTPSPGVEKQLVCQNVPTTNLPVGNYSFQLFVESNQDQKGQAITQGTDTISIKPKAITIKEFFINEKIIAQPSSSLRYFVLPGTPLPLEISWDVDGGENIQVELHPWPGNINSKNSITYEIPPGSKQETITLKVTDPLGNTTIRSVLIQVYESDSEGIHQFLEGTEPTKDELSPTQIEELLESPPQP